MADPPAELQAASQLGIEFDVLRAAPGLDLGAPLGIEQTPADAAPDSCDVQQPTTTGVAYWSCLTDVASFVANDGVHRWAFQEGQFLEWAGGDPLGTVPSGLPPAVNLVCLGPNDAPQDACIVASGTTTDGFIDAPGASRLYAFQVSMPVAQVHVDLTYLPADYDLYLVDGSTEIVAQSAQEGTEPEAIDAVLSPGTFLLYVHSDPGRAVDPDNPFVLHLDVQPAASDSVTARAP